jgi:hypothetical protein
MSATCSAYFGAAGPHVTLLLYGSTAMLRSEPAEDKQPILVDKELERAAVPVLIELVSGDEAGGTTAVGTLIVVRPNESWALALHHIFVTHLADFLVLGV